MQGGDMLRSKTETCSAIMGCLSHLALCGEIKPSERELSSQHENYHWVNVFLMKKEDQ